MTVPGLDLTLSGPFRIGMIWAQARGGGIGREGTLPWHIPEDLAHFRNLTHGHPVLHGRRSYEALPPRFRPLPGRRNLVLTTDAGYEAPGAEVVHSIREAFDVAGEQPLWIVGGAQVYRAAMEDADVIVVSEVDLDVEADTYAPEIDPRRWHPVRTSRWVRSSAGPRFRVLEYRRIPR